MELEYFTRDAKGNDFTKIVKIKEFPEVDVDTECPICNEHITKGSPIKKIVSANFTDWAYVGDYICKNCCNMFSLYFYNYIIENNEIQLVNVRQIKDMLLRPHKPPFRICITTSQKKHLFYKSILNNSDESFAVNLETEPIFTTHNRMKKLFLFVETLQALGATKQAMTEGNIYFSVKEKIGMDLYSKCLFLLDYEIKNSREIQIPLYCGQKLDITEEQAICNINLILQS